MPYTSGCFAASAALRSTSRLLLPECRGLLPKLEPEILAVGHVTSCDPSVGRME